MCIKKIVYVAVHGLSVADDLKNMCSNILLVNKSHKKTEENNELCLLM